MAPCDYCKFRLLRRRKLRFPAPGPAAYHAARTVERMPGCREDAGRNRIGSRGRRRSRRACACRRSRLARNFLHIDRTIRRLDLSAAHGPGRRPHHGILPALGPGAGGRSLAIPARLRAGQYLPDQPDRPRTGPRALSGYRPGAAAQGEPAAARALPAEYVRSDFAELRGVAKKRRDALPHPAGLVHAGFRVP